LNAGGWRVEMAKWISEARLNLRRVMMTQRADVVVNDRQCGNTAAWKWKQLTLALLFGGEKPPRSRLPPEEVDAESQLMEALAKLEKDERPDDGEVKIPSDEEFIG